MKQDPKLVSSKQKWEPSGIATRHKIPVKVVREAMLLAGPKGKPARSRKDIYAKLREMGYSIPVSNPWISVAKNLPKKVKGYPVSDTVKFKTRNKVYEGWRNTSSGAWIEKEDFQMIEKVTHWKFVM